MKREHLTILCGLALLLASAVWLTRCEPATETRSGLEWLLPEQRRP